MSRKWLGLRSPAFSLRCNSVPAGWGGGGVAYGCGHVLPGEAGEWRRNTCEHAAVLCEGWGVGEGEGGARAHLLQPCLGCLRRWSPG